MECTIANNYHYITKWEKEAREVALAIKDGKKIFSDIDSVKNYTAQYFEEIAKGDPDHTWVMFFNLPMSSSVYTRKSDGIWILTHTDDGFV